MLIVIFFVLECFSVYSLKIFVLNHGAKHSPCIAPLAWPLAGFQNFRTCVVKIFDVNRKFRDEVKNYETNNFETTQM